MTKPSSMSLKLLGSSIPSTVIADALGVELEDFLERDRSTISTCNRRQVKIEMPTEPSLENYFFAVIKEGLYPNRGNLQFHLNTLFKDITFENRRVLDIGGGSGLHSFYVACIGAKEVVCLEPETKGSRSGTREKFRKVGKILGQDHVRFEPVTFQAFDPGGKAI